MSRLGKRVSRLEGSRPDGVDLIATVPASWPAERQSEEVEAIALAHGAMEPFGKVILLQCFGASEEESAEVIFMGRLGMDAYLSQPLTRRDQ